MPRQLTFVGKATIDVGQTRSNYVALSLSAGDFVAMSVITPTQFDGGAHLIGPDGVVCMHRGVLVELAHGAVVDIPLYAVPVLGVETTMPQQSSVDFSFWAWLEW